MDETPNLPYLGSTVLKLLYRHNMNMTELMDAIDEEEKMIMYAVKKLLQLDLLTKIPNLINMNKPLYTINTNEMSVMNELISDTTTFPTV